MADSITRCPKCQTSFRITEAHLKSAKGAVRCGSCLTIFNAKDHLISHTDHAGAAASSAKPKAKALTNKPLTNKAKPATAQPKAAAQKKLVLPPDEDDMLISDDMDMVDDDSPSNDSPFNTDFNDNILYSKSMASTESNLFERGQQEEDDDDEQKSDESWALDLLNSSDEEEELPKFKKDTGAFPAVEEPKPPTAKPKAVQSDYESDFALDDDDDAEKFITQHYPALDAEQVEEELRKTGFHEPVFTAIEPSIEELDRDPDEDDYGNRTAKPFIHAIEPEPVEFSYRSAFSITDSNWLWGPLTLAMALILVFLVGWLQFGKLSRIEPYRGYYGYACTLFGCELPVLISRQDIRAVNLVVRSHPSESGALVVDAVLQNTAGFAQPFPSLDLVFTDVAEKPVAARRFSPREYLGGELAGKTQMPSQQPIHIALEIVDPGPDAVGYRIEIAN